MVESRERYSMKLNDQGGITVTLALMIPVILLLLLVLLEGIHVSFGKQRLCDQFFMAQESVLADYDPFLWQEYHILAVDETYHTDSSAMLSHMLKQYAQEEGTSSLKGFSANYPYTIEELTVTDPVSLLEEGVLVNEIRAYMAKSVTRDVLLQTFADWNQDQKQQITSVKEEMEACEKEAASQKEQKDLKETEDKKASADQTVQSKVKDPRKELNKVRKKGLLSFVSGREDWSKEPYDLQALEDSIKSQWNSREETAEDESIMEFDKTEDVTSHLKQSWDKQSVTEEVITKAAVALYAGKHFSSMVQTAERPSGSDTNAMKQTEEEEQVMQCQLEYLLCGKQSDYDNANSIVHRLLAIRFPVNFAYAATAPDLVAEANAVAAELAGATLNPAVIEVTAYLLLAAESYAEALLDVRKLLHGGRVPYLKTASNFKISLRNLPEVLQEVLTENETKNSQKQDNSEEGLYYADYLGMLLFLQPQQVQCCRMLCVMEKRGQQNRTSFALSHMLFSFQAEEKAVLAPAFGKLPFSDLGKGHIMTFRKVISY